jgi:flagellar motor protein MotB
VKQPAQSGKRWREAVVAAAAAALLFGCGGAPLRVAAIEDMNRVRGSAGAQEGARLAPEVVARAEQERDFALRAHASGDQVGATLHAERAVAAYDHALVVARLARASTELADATKALNDVTTQAQGLEASRDKLHRDADDLEQRIRVARERMLPAASGTADAEREAARAVAARSLGMQARLLCDAARLVASDAPGLGEADDQVAKLDERLARGARPAPIDDAAAARVHCLEILTRARRARGDDTNSADALLAELSASGGWDPVRDERGVVVTLHDAFRGAELAGEAASKLKELGRVAAAHSGFAMQVVVHDAQPVAAKDTTDAKRADAAVQALVAGGATASRIKAETAGTRAPLVDPSDAKARRRNERVDIVFVGF